LQGGVSSVFRRRALTAAAGGDSLQLSVQRPWKSNVDAAAGFLGSGCVLTFALLHGLALPASADPRCVQGFRHPGIRPSALPVNLQAAPTAALLSR